MSDLNLVGTDGDDSLAGDTGNDTLDGGLGNDILNGDGGNDTYHFGRGSGHDTIVDHDTTPGNLDTVQFGTNIKPSDLLVTRDNNSLYIAIKGTADSLKIQDYYLDDGANQIERFNFVNGTVLVDLEDRIVPASATAGDDTIYGSINNDWIDGKAGNDKLLANDGDDVLIGGLDNDTLDGGLGNDTMSGGTGDDWYYVDSAGDVVVENANEGDEDIVWSSVSWTLDPNTEHLGLTGNTPIDGTGNALDNVIAGNSADNVLTGGTGDDVLAGSTGNDTYVFNRGDGADQIIDEINISSDGKSEEYGDAGSDTLRFGAGIGLDDLDLSESGADIFVSLRGSNGDRVQFVNWADPNRRIETIAFADGSRIATTDLIQEGGSGDDSLSGNGYNNLVDGGAGNDTLTGGGGRDTLTGGQGDDVYVFNRGDGSERISDYFVSDAKSGTYGDAGNDTLQFGAGIALDDLDFSMSGSDLVVSLRGSSDQVTLTNWDDSNRRVENIRFADDTSVVASDLVLMGSVADDELNGNAFDNLIFGREGNDILAGGTGVDSLIGGQGNDVYVFSRGDGSDLVQDSAGDYIDAGADTIRFGSGIFFDDLTFTLSGPDLVIGLRDSSDQVTLQNWSDPNQRVETIELADGSTAVLGDLVGSYQEGTSGKDTLTGSDGNDLLFGMDGNDSLVGNAGNDTLNGGAGSDTLNGGFGSDTYIFGRGYGIDFISSSNYSLPSFGSASDGDIDVVRFAADVSPSDVSLSRHSWTEYDWIMYHLRISSDLKISIIGTSDSLIIGNFFSSSSSTNGQLVFADGTVWDAATIKAQMLAGTDGNDIIPGDGGDNLIAGGGGDDLLMGDAGNDTLEGGSGNDTLVGYWADITSKNVNPPQFPPYPSVGSPILSLPYGVSATDPSSVVVDNNTYRFGIGSGNDVIYERDYSGSWALPSHDVIEFGAGVLPADILVTRGGLSTIYLKIISTGETLTVDGGVGMPIEQVRFADGTTWDDDLRAHVTLGATTAGNDAIYGSSLGDSIDGGAGDDVLYGYEGDDTLTGGTGNDTLEDWAGSNTYHFDRGDGQDFAEHASLSDVVEFGTDIAPEDITVTRDYNYIYLTINGTGDQMKAYRDLGGVRFADGTTWNNLLANHVTFQVTSGDDSLYGSDLGDSIDGLAGNDTISGQAGDDTLCGGPGTDSLIGGGGNDTYLINDSVDSIQESSGLNTGTDTILASVSYTLQNNVYVENFTLVGSDAINAIGNNLANALTGNDGDNQIYGNNGNDTLTGGRAATRCAAAVMPIPMSFMPETATTSLPKTISPGVSVMPSTSARARIRTNSGSSRSATISKSTSSALPMR